tara:strand:+ start:228 stop:488 length:261 start_codon:yes stop_codon:yes gene_type:complete
MTQALYLIFTEAGFAEAKTAVMEEKALLWINPDVLDDTELKELNNAQITVKILDDWVKPGDEKATLTIINQIEKNIKNVSILVEYL